MTAVSTATMYDTTSRRVQAGEFDLHYHDLGSGSPVILLHGGGPGASGWSNFSENVEALAEQHRVLVVDMPGFGASGAHVFETEQRTSGTARALRLFLDALGIDVADLIGNSMGGSVCIELAIASPERVGRLVLIGTGNGGPSLFSPLPTEGDKLLGPAMRNPTPESLRRLFEIMVYDPERFVTDRLIEERMAVAADPAKLAARRKSLRKVGEPLAELERITAPTLVVWGREDRFNPMDIGLRVVSMIPDCRMHIFSRCGHWAQLEHASEFNRLVLDFLAHSPEAPASGGG